MNLSHLVRKPNRVVKQKQAEDVKIEFMKFGVFLCGTKSADPAAYEKNVKDQ